MQISVLAKAFNEQCHMNCHQEKHPCDELYNTGVSCTLAMRSGITSWQYQILWRVVVASACRQVLVLTKHHLSYVVWGQHLFQVSLIELQQIIHLGIQRCSVYQALQSIYTGKALGKMLL